MNFAEIGAPEKVESDQKFSIFTNTSSVAPSSTGAFSSEIRYVNYIYQVFNKKQNQGFKNSITSENEST